jgi:K+-sensing histidine kinase KdpD
MKFNAKAIAMHPIVATIVVGALVTFAVFAGFLLAKTGVNTPYLALLPAVVLCCDFYGFRYSLWAAIAGTVSAWYFFVTPVWTFEPPSLGDFVQLVSFLGVTLFACWVIEEQRRYIRQLETALGGPLQADAPVDAKTRGESIARP